MANRTTAQAPHNTSVVTTESKPTQAVAFKVKGSNHAVQVFADCSIWDTVSNTHVLPEDTNFKDSK